MAGDGTFKALILDIETVPHTAKVWGLWNETIPLARLLEAGEVICFAAKWLDDPHSKTMFFSNHHDGHEVMVQAAWDLVNEADAVIHYNGKNFDMKHLHREFLLAGLTPPAPHRDIDLLQVARATFKFASNRLDHVAQELGVGAKVKHAGYEVWEGCIADDPKSWAEMKKYNIGDIKVTEGVYHAIKPWIRTHPHVGSYTGDLHSCRVCGSKDLQRRGFARTSVSVFQRYRCKDCGAWSRAAHRMPDMTVQTRSVTG
mgnify:CR=1 FL=1